METTRFIEVQRFSRFKLNTLEIGADDTEEFTEDEELDEYLFNLDAMGDDAEVVAWDDVKGK